MSKLSDALGVMDKATPEPWWGDDEAPELIWAKRDGDTFHVVDSRGCDVLSAIIHIIAAAPDALAWIKEALPWLEEMRLHVSLDPAHYDHELARLDALIARAKPEEVGE